MDLIKFVRNNGLVPVLAVQDASLASGLGRALIEGGLPIAEVTLRTDCALEVIKTMASIDGLVTGAGTVINGDDAEKVIAAGVEFIVSPALSAEVSAVCKKHGVLYIPGVATPRDIQDAIALGHKVVKFFPAEACGGVKTLKAFAAPYGAVTFMPTGGINTGNLADYLNLPFVEACGGSWLVGKEDLKNSNWSAIEATVKEAVQLVKDIRG